MRRALRERLSGPPPDSTIVEAVGHKLQYENGPQGIARARPFDGVREILHEINASNRPVAILSNKTQEEVVLSVSTHFSDIQWAFVGGATPGLPLKPYKTVPLNIVRDHMPGLSPVDVAFIGDTEIDMRTGYESGMVRIGVTWGFRPAEQLRDAGAEYLVNDASELLSIINRQ